MLSRNSTSNYSRFEEFFRQLKSVNAAMEHLDKTNFIATQGKPILLGFEEKRIERKPVQALQKALKELRSPDLVGGDDLNEVLHDFLLKQWPYKRELQPELKKFEDLRKKLFSKSILVSFPSDFFDRLNTSIDILKEDPHFLIATPEEKHNNLELDARIEEQLKNIIINCIKEDKDQVSSAYLPLVNFLRKCIKEAFEGGSYRTLDLSRVRQICLNAIIGLHLANDLESQRVDHLLDIILKNLDANAEQDRTIIDILNTSWLGFIQMSVFKDGKEKDRLESTLDTLVFKSRSEFLQGVKDEVELPDERGTLYAIEIYTNQLKNCVLEEILSPNNYFDRVAALKKWVIQMKSLHERKDFQSVYAIMWGLSFIINSAPDIVAGLKRNDEMVHRQLDSFRALAQGWLQSPDKFAVTDAVPPLPVIRYLKQNKVELLQAIYSAQAKSTQPDRFNYDLMRQINASEPVHRLGLKRHNERIKELKKQAAADRSIEERYTDWLEERNNFAGLLTLLTGVIPLLVFVISQIVRVFSGTPNHYSPLMSDVSFSKEVDARREGQVQIQSRSTTAWLASRGIEVTSPAPVVVPVTDSAVSPTSNSSSASPATSSSDSASPATSSDSESPISYSEAKENDDNNVEGDRSRANSLP